MTKQELDTVMKGVHEINADMANQISDAVVVALNKSENALIEKITALEKRLQTAENCLNQAIPNNAHLQGIVTGPAGTSNAANTYEF